MYLNFYHLKKEPFNVTPDPEFLFLSAGHKEALASIVYAVENRKGFMTITGEVGVGKTTILRSYLKEIDQQRLKTIYVFNANVSFEGLLKTIFEELDIHSETNDVFGMVNHLQKVLIDEYKQGNNIVLIIDEAQNIPFETLENLRMLSNLETYTDKLIQIVLIGQPEFEKMLNLNKLRQLKQRIAVRTTISPLTQKESMTYIQHRLDKAGVSDATIFTKGALKLIVNKTEGIPRLLNILCDNALITGYGYQQKPVTSRIIKEVIADFEGERKFPVLKWAIVYSTVFLLLGAICWFSPYKNQALSRFRSIAVSLNFQINQIKEGFVSLSMVKDEISEPTINIVPLTTTVQVPTNSINPSKYVNNADIAWKENDLDIYKNKNGKYDMRDKSIKLQVKTHPLTTSLERRQLGETTKSNQTSFDNDQLLNEESLNITNKTIYENSVAENLIAKLEKERTVLGKLKSKFQERITTNKFSLQ